MICKYAEIFCWKNVSSKTFAVQKLLTFFSAKNIRIFAYHSMYIESAKTANEMTLNELVMLTTLWTTGPCLLFINFTSVHNLWLIHLFTRMDGSKIKDWRVHLRTCRPHWLSWMRHPTGDKEGSRVQPPPRSATFFRGDWSWNIFYRHSLPSADSRRAVVSFWRKNVHNTA